MSIWKVYAKKADFYGIGKKYNIDPVIARVIRNRGVIEEKDIDMYLSTGQESLKILHNPRTLLNMDKVVSIIKEKKSSSAKIRIIGDYDIDGICSSTTCWCCIWYLFISMYYWWIVVYI